MERGLSARDLLVAFIIFDALRLFPRMLDQGIRGMIFLGESTAKNRALPLVIFPAKHSRWAVVSVDTEVQITILAIDARIQTGEEGDCFELFFGGLVIVLEAAFATLGTGATEVVVVT
jgi:hypothetical protein